MQIEHETQVPAIHNLTDDQIGLIRIAILNHKKDCIDCDKYDEILGILEYGCAVEVANCAMASQREIAQLRSYSDEEIAALDELHKPTWLAK